MADPTQRPDPDPPERRRGGRDAPVGESGLNQSPSFWPSCSSSRPSQVSCTARWRGPSLGP